MKGLPMYNIALELRRWEAAGGEHATADASGRELGSERTCTATPRHVQQPSYGMICGRINGPIKRVWMR